MRYRVALVVSVILVWSCLAGTALSAGAEFIEPDRKDKCPVCGMFVYKYPSWVAEIIFKDGTYAVFDGPKDMFRYYFNISKYNRHKTRADIAEIYVTEYYTTRRMRAKDVVFVIGSNVYGPMGEELVPVKGRKAAEAFARDHGGRRMLTFDQITPEDIPGH